MKLDKAIELSENTEKSLRQHKFIDYADAVKLGIEALKEVKKARYGDPALDGELLPGEDSEPATRRSLHHIKAVSESPLGREPKG